MSGNILSAAAAAVYRATVRPGVERALRARGPMDHGHSVASTPALHMRARALLALDASGRLWTSRAPAKFGQLSSTLPIVGDVLPQSTEVIDPQHVVS